MTRYLLRQGHLVGRKRVARLKKNVMGLEPICQKPGTGTLKTRLKVHKYVLNDLEVTRPIQSLLDGPLTSCISRLRRYHRAA